MRVRFLLSSVAFVSFGAFAVAGCSSSDSGGSSAADDSAVAVDTQTPLDDTRAHLDDTGQDVTHDTAEAGSPDTGASSDTTTSDTAAADTATSDTATTDTGAPETSGETGATTWEVTVGGTGFVFTPSTLAIKVGDTVHWTWAGSGHSVTSGAACTPDGQFDTTTTLSAGATFSHTFDTAGSYPYFCRPHCAAGMVGTITVAP